LYVDDDPFFAARQVPGCFTVSQVRESLGQSVAVASKSTATQLHGEGEEHGHFLPDCVCSPIHVNCGDSPTPEASWATINVTLDQLRAASEAGCPFCRTIFGGCMAAPPWDPTRKDKTPKREVLGLSTRPQGLDFGMSLFQLRDPALMFYVNEEEGS
jgi:hypothetical protein